MKQILQSLKTGATELAEVPCPAAGRGQLLVRTSRTLISSGTERMLVDFSRANLLDKARQQPEKVRMVLNKLRTDGLAATIERVLDQLDQTLPMGYCNVGVVAAIGTDVNGFAVGDCVVSNGKHAEVVSVPANLCAKVPGDVSVDSAAFVVIGAIGLQGIRLAKPTLGESVAVIGLGLIGLITVQLLRAQGCRVIGLDLDPVRLAQARHFGAEVIDISGGQDPAAAAIAFSRGRGVDAVIITAATKSNGPVHQAAQMCRKRGRVVLVGVTGLELSRDDFFKKELTFQVSSSYGPGRYDPNYEEKGQDYPVGFVRWTAQRNFEAVLDLMAGGRLDVASLISHRYPLAEAEKAYEVVAGDEPSMGILLEYPGFSITPESRTVALTEASAAKPVTSDTPVVGFIGAGNYATAILIPAFKAAGARLRTIVSNQGVTGLHAGRKFGFAETSTDISRVLEDPTINIIVISTRHDSHAAIACRALAAHKHVFLEKPVAITADGLLAVEGAYRGCMAKGRPPIFMVGFNRRFAPQVQRMKALLATVTGPKVFVMIVNAGAIPGTHWVQDEQVGGGRIVGEACHFVDLLRHLGGVQIVRWQVRKMTAHTPDTAILALDFADGSVGTIHYLANGHPGLPKERLEVFAGGRILQLDNFRKLIGLGWPHFSKMNLWRQDKGQRAGVAAFLHAVTVGGPSPIPFEEVVEVSRISLELERLARSG